MLLQEAAAAAQAEAQQLRKQNALLAAEVEGARDAVSQLLDRISGMQVRRFRVPVCCAMQSVQQPD